MDLVQSHTVPGRLELPKHHAGRENPRSKAPRPGAAHVNLHKIENCSHQSSELEDSLELAGSQVSANPQAKASEARAGPGVPPRGRQDAKC